ncbi:MAG: hypothetical protein JSV91_00145 [Phycisphaerales bacterium]|nr:MAG: hypothetical protein JSV91_00145 [Phycisphaerales bacterium]
MPDYVLIPAIPIAMKVGIVERWFLSQYELIRAQQPGTYRRIPIPGNRLKPEHVIELIKFVSDEMESNRKRQIAIFREAVIAIALVTWAAILIPRGLDASVGDRRWIGWSAFCLCLAASLLGGRIIFLYRQRIYHLRNSREDLVRHIRPKLRGDNTKDPPTTWLFPPVGPPTGSLTYFFSLLAVGAVGAVFNLSAINFTDRDNLPSQPANTANVSPADAIRPPATRGEDVGRSADDSITG